MDAVMRFIIFGTGSIQLFLEEALASMLLLVVHSPILSTTTTTNSIGRVQWWPMMGNGLESSFVCPRDIRKLPIHFSTCTAKGASCKEETRARQNKIRSCRLIHWYQTGKITWSQAPSFTNPRKPLGLLSHSMLEAEWWKLGGCSCLC